jgi:RNA polymerase sigma-70 factor (ECF subfamily)
MMPPDPAAAPGGPRTDAPSDTPSDETLMTALAAGDSAALDTLMLRWQRPLQAYLLRHLGNEADALDLAQETFVRLYRARARYRPGARFTTWMFQIALNLARDHARKRARRRTDSLEDAAPGSTAGLASPGPTPDLAVRRAEEIAAVRSALAALPDELREVLVLFEYEDLSHARIAEIIGASPKAVETRLYRAREKLRSSLTRWLKS